MQYLLLLLFTPLFSGKDQQKVFSAEMVSPLSEFSAEWNEPRYSACNTAATANYMSFQEKNVIYILNLARANPKLFCSTVVKKYPSYSSNYFEESTDYFRSLVATMEKMQPLNLLDPSAQCYNSAQCHAFNSGQREYVGHERSGKCNTKKYYNGECCDYGHDKALDIVMSLLIDYDVPSLGHRDICFSHYATIGVSIQPHKTWGRNAVLDFHY